MAGMALVPVSLRAALTGPECKKPTSDDVGFSVSGASGPARTGDPCLRRAVLYPTELRMQVVDTTRYG